MNLELGGIHKLRLQDLAFFDHLPPSVYIFYGIKVYKKSIFLTTYPPPLVNVVCERPQTCRKKGQTISWDLEIGAKIFANISVFLLWKIIELAIIQCKAIKTLITLYRVATLPRAWISSEAKTDGTFLGPFFTPTSVSLSVLTKVDLLVELDTQSYNV